MQRPWPTEQITERDDPALQHLVDITCSRLEGDQKGFILDFHFAQPNPYFSNAVLSKTYNMIDEEDPMLESVEGTEIQWLPGKNLCVKVRALPPLECATDSPASTE